MASSYRNGRIKLMREASAPISAALCHRPWKTPSVKTRPEMHHGSPSRTMRAVLAEGGGGP